MPLFFNTLLSQYGIDPKDVRLLRHKDNRSEKGRSPFELWRDERDLYEKYQSVQYVGHRKHLDSKYWASFIGTPAKETMFTGLYQIEHREELEEDQPMIQMEGVDEAGTCDVYTLEIDERFQEYDGRLTIEWGKGERAWIQRAENQNKRIVEIRKEYQEPLFPGYIEFWGFLSTLNTLPKTWISVLKSAKGIYLLTCPNTKEQYVGSATGEQGFWGRWQEYVKIGHGNNVGLKNHGKSDYIVSILEVAGTIDTDKDILIKETLWKNKLQSKEMGLNMN
jgi:hypothetical protein